MPAHSAAWAQLERLHAGLQALLAQRLVALYVEGSLATGAFDSASDLDCVAVVRDRLTARDVNRLQAFHAELATAPSPWSTDLEIWYVPPAALLRSAGAADRHLNLERGKGQRLKWAELGADWSFHRTTLHRSGIALCGPPPADLVEDVPPGELRRSVCAHAQTWATPLLRRPAQLHSRGYQSYVVLSCCRLLYTLAHDRIASKTQAAAWATATLGPRWSAPIASALAGRFAPGEPSSGADRDHTRDLIRLLLERCCA